MSWAASSVPWLLTHELRLYWRSVGGARTWLLLLVGGVLWLAGHFAAWAIVSSWVAQGAELSPMAWVYGGVGTWALLTVLLSTAIALSVTALFERGDMDLLLASPIPVETIFWVRGIGIAVASMVLWFLLLSPFAHVGLIAGRPTLLAVYPVLFSLGLLLTAIGMTLTLTLVHWLGARRARVVAQLLGALVGALFFLSTQLQNLLSDATRNALSQQLQRMVQPQGLFAPDSVLWYPFRALMGELLPAFWVCFLGIGFFWLAVKVTGHVFVSGLQQAQGDGASTVVVSQGHRVKAFRKTFVMNVLVKEWKLIARDPNLIAQTLLQVLYLLPMFLAFARKDGITATLAPALVFVAAILAGSLCWLTVAAEDAPDLLGSAPVPLTQLRWYKVVAALVPVWLLLSPMLLFASWHDPRQLLVLLPCLTGGTLSAGVVQIWFPRQGNRRDLKKRSGAGLVQGILELVSAAAWSATAYVAVKYPLWLLLTLSGALLGPLGAWWSGGDKRKAGV